MSDLRADLMGLYARLLKGKAVDTGDAVTVLAAADRIEELRESGRAYSERRTSDAIRIADKDASIAQLIEQLQKAEAQNAALIKPLFKGFGTHAADCGCSRCENRTEGGLSGR